MEPRGHKTTINHQQGTVLYRIGMGNNINVPLMIYIVMVKISSAAKNATLPYTCFLLSKKVTKRPHDEMKRLRGPINQRTLEQASADIDEGGIFFRTALFRLNSIGYIRHCHGLLYSGIDIQLKLIILLEGGV
ncbi:hypothetical protein AAC387_Pa09g0788 [Persea americana]